MALALFSQHPTGSESATRLEVPGPTASPYNEHP